MDVEITGWRLISYLHFGLGDSQTGNMKRLGYIDRETMDRDMIFYHTGLFAESQEGLELILVQTERR